MPNSSIWPIDMTLSFATTPSQCEPGSEGYEKVPRIPQSSGITGVSSLGVISRTLVGGRSYPSAEMQSVYCTTPTDWAKNYCDAYF